MVFAEVNGEQPGATLTGSSPRLTAKILSENPLATIEVIVNGKVIRSLKPQNNTTLESAFQSEVDTDLAVATSGWACLRCTEDRPDKRLRFAHTAPWWLDVPGTTLRPTLQEKEYLVGRVERELVRSIGILPDSAIKEYREALRHFESMQAAGEVTTNNADSKFDAITPDFTTLVATDAGLWPQLQIADDGTLLAFGYNAPAHTTLPADVECWASFNGGRTWASRAIAAARPAVDANYCHWASGMLNKNEVLVLASGMNDAANAKGLRKPNDVRVFRSKDAGANWKPDGEFPMHMPGTSGNLKPYPFGSIVSGADGHLRTLVYTSDEQNNNVEAAWILTSRDRGQTWIDPRKLADGINESVLLPLAGKEWLCVARTSNKPAPEYGQELRQFRSLDDGVTWTDEGLVAGYHLHPPHLLRLSDGRILLTYGNRREATIEVRFSQDNGHAWSKPATLFSTSRGDMGYPSTAQLPDGRLVTIFYAQGSPLRDGYHMGAIGWKPRLRSTGAL